MRKIIATEYMTLDGVMEAPGTETSLGSLSGWVFPFHSDEMWTFKFEELLASDAMLLGRVTYEIFAATWPKMTDETGFADRINGMAKYVVSSTLNELAWNNSHLIKDDIAQEVAQLKQTPGQDILLVGSADVVHALMPHGLIDEYRIMVFPVVLGAGKPLFRAGSHINLRLVDTKTFSKGVVLLTYRPETR